MFFNNSEKQELNPSWDASVFNNRFDLNVCFEKNDT